MSLERIAGFEIHPAASRFPLMSDVELDELARDIKERGLDQPIQMHEGKVLDGRNRLLACEKAGVEPSTTAWDCRGGSPVAYVLSANVRRRHLTESQRAMIAAELLPDFEAEARVRQKATLKKGKEQPVSAPVREREKSADRAAQAAAVSTRYVEAAKAVAQRSPELAAKVKSGEVTLKRAEKEIRKKEQVRLVKAYVPPAGQFSVIAIDVSWPFEDELDGSDDARGGLPYPPMTMEEICALKLPADENCILFCWTTNTHLINGDAARAVKAWGFTAKTLLTWNKERMGTGRWLRGITEHCIIAVKGKATVELTNQTTLISEPRREHSRKPEAFYALVEKLCPSPNRIEMFSRTPREGWVTDGPEKEQFKPEKCIGHAKLFQPCARPPGKSGRCKRCAVAQKRSDDAAARAALKAAPEIAARDLAPHPEPAENPFPPFPGGAWRISRARNPKAHAYLLAEPDVSLCGANIGKSGDAPTEKDRRCSLCNLKVDVLIEHEGPTKKRASGCAALGCKVRTKETFCSLHAAQEHEFQEALAKDRPAQGELLTETAPGWCIGFEGRDDSEGPCNGVPSKKTQRCSSCTTRHAWVQKRTREGGAEKK